MPLHRHRLPSGRDGRIRSELAASLAALRAELGLPEAFPPEVEAEAADAARRVPTDPDAAGVDDLRDVPFLTIDPAGAKDLDQALAIELVADGAVVHYAIADVAAYVEPGGAIDVEARQRGQTMYGADGRAPLHPAVLSEDAASLLPDRDRRAVVWRFELDADARIRSTGLRRATVRSRRQWTYLEAQEAIDAGTAPPELAGLAWLGPRRETLERERGGASLDVPETTIVLDDGPVRLERRPGPPIERWNAQLSLMTGMAAADLMLAGGVGILRTMPPAADDDVAAFRAQTRALGAPWPAGVAYGEYLGSLDRADPAALAVLDAATSLFRGAGYAAFDGEAPESVVQSAIGAPYSHATAPLRRLVDRWVLVVCEALANGRPIPDWARESLGELPAAMGRSEALAGRLSSGTLDRVEAAVLSGREGEAFTAVVLRTTATTSRVQLAEPPVAATVPALEAPVGGEVELRLQRVDIATGAVELVPV